MPRDEADDGMAEAEAADDEAAAAAAAATVGGTIEATPPALFRPIARLLTGPKLACAEAALTVAEDGGTGAL